MDCAEWGVSDPRHLSFLDPPSEAALVEGRSLLHRLGALDERGSLTAMGQTMRQIGLPAREAAMVTYAASRGYGNAAARLAVLMSERGLGGRSVDLERRFQGFDDDRTKRAKQARSLAGRIAKAAGSDTEQSEVTLESGSAGLHLLHGFSDRVAKRRGPADGDQCRYRLANGRGSYLDASDPLAQEPFLVVTDLTGKLQSQRILSAAPVSSQMIEEELAEQIEEQDDIRFDTKSGRVRAQRKRMLMSLVLSQTNLPKPPAEAALQALCAGLREIGLGSLPWSKAGLQLRARMDWLHRSIGEPWPDMSDAALLERLDDWFAPFQAGADSLASIKSDGLENGLMSLLPFDLRAEFDRLAPSHFVVPTGSKLPIRYEQEDPVLAVRVQELFGMKQHPSIADGRIPLLLELLSPAQRPIQTTRDLPTFWNGSWSDVRSEMRGRYPKHPWPDDPANTAPTRRAKPSRNGRTGHGLFAAACRNTQCQSSEASHSDPPSNAGHYWPVHCRCCGCLWARLSFASCVMLFADSLSGASQYRFTAGLSTNPSAEPTHIDTRSGPRHPAAGGSALHEPAGWKIRFRS